MRTQRTEHPGSIGGITESIVINISLLQNVNYVSNMYLSCILYMLLPLDVGIIYLLDVNKCTHLVSGGIHSIFPEILLWSRLLEISAVQYLIII